MTHEQLKSLLRAHDNEKFVDEHILERRPWIFGADADYDGWLESVAAGLSLKRDNIRIVGSAATGYSLSPLKPGRPFRSAPGSWKPSDVDIAFSNAELFEAAWNLIVMWDRGRRLGMGVEERIKTRIDVYWGVVSQRSVPLNTDPARWILTALSIARRHPPIRGYEVRCRVYRRPEDLRAYHINSIRQLRAAIGA